MSQETPPHHQSVAFVFPVDVLERMRALARQHQRSLVGEIVWALRQYIAEQERHERG